jgi:hypothetical protein
MSKTFRLTIGVLVLLAGGTLVTACRSSSDKDQSKGATETVHSKVERTHAASPAGEAATSKAHAQAKAHAKAEPGSKESYTSTRPGGKPAPTDPLSSMNP